MLDWGAYLYKLEKKERKKKSRQKEIEIKGIRLSFNIASHDLEVRLKQAQKFLEKGNKVKIEMILRGRELAHQDRARQLFKDFIEALKERGLSVREDQPLKKQGKRFSQIISLASK